MADLKDYNMLAKSFPSIQGVKDAEDIIGSKEVDAVVIATPVHTHFELAKRALLQGKHVLIRKAHDFLSAGGG